MSLPPISNAAAYKAIATEAHQNMHEYLTSGRKPKIDGSNGWIVSYDPERKSFKQALITIVFAAMWLTAIIHILIVRHSGAHTFNKRDKKISLEKGLRLLGCTDEILLAAVQRLQISRKELAHEKAYTDPGGINFAQDEADNAYWVIIAIEKHFFGPIKHKI